MNSRTMLGRSDATWRVGGLNLRIFLLVDHGMDVERGTSDLSYLVVVGRR
jgi:hypothetical protein